MSDLEATVSRIVNMSSLLTSHEEATRQSAVLPVLSDLGWQWFDPDEVTPEYGAGTGRVDYCLRHLGRSVVFIEVKRAGTDLHPHQPQLLRYAFDEGVDLAVLTDGFNWWFYLPTAPTNWEQRRFFSIDLRRIESAKSATLLKDFLARDAVLSGEAVRKAQSQFADQERLRRIGEALPLAWKQLATAPDELLVELISDAVTGIAGHTPDPDDVALFLRSLLGGNGEPPLPLENPPVAPTAPTAPKPASPPVAVSVSVSSSTAMGDFTGKTPTTVILQGRQLRVSTWRDVLAAVCELAAQNPDFPTRALELRGRKRPYFSTTGDELRGVMPVKGTGLFVESNLSANNIVSFCQVLLRTFVGSDEGFSIKVNDDRPRRRRRTS